MSAVVCKLRKEYGHIHDTKCPHWDQVSLNNTISNSIHIITQLREQNLKISENIIFKTERIGSTWIHKTIHLFLPQKENGSFATDFHPEEVQEIQVTPLNYLIFHLLFEKSLSDSLGGDYFIRFWNAPLIHYTDGYECYIYRLGNDCMQFKLSHKPGVAGLNCGGW